MVPCTEPSYPLNTMLPSTNPLATAALLFCLWKPRLAPLAAVLLVALNTTFPLAVMRALAVTGAVEAKLVAELTARVLLPLLPSTALPLAVSTPATLTAALAVMGAVTAKVVAAFTVRVWLPLAPRTTLPLAVRAPFAVMSAVAANVVTALIASVWPPLAPRTTLPLAVMAAFAVIVAEVAKVVTALTVRVWEAEVPSTVLPAAVRMEAVLARVTPPLKVARPELSRVRRSTGCPLLLLVLPAALVLNTRLPPVLPVASYAAHAVET